MSEDRTNRIARPKRPASRSASPARKRPGNPRATAATAERRPQRRTRPKARSRFAFGKVFGHTFARRFLASVAAAIVLILIFIACMRVKTVSVVGNAMYTREQIQEASGVANGNALLLVNKTAIASRIRAQLPYVDEVRVGVQLPSTVKIEVVELKNTFAVAADDGYWLINSDGRLVEQITAKKASEYLMIEGVRIEKAAVGEQAQVMDDPAPPAKEETGDAQADSEDEPDAPAEPPAADRMKIALQIVDQLEAEKDIRSITTVDVTSAYNIEIWYGTQFQVKLGTSDELSYKLNYMLAAIAQLDGYQSGVLDLTFQEAKKASFIPWPN